MKLSTIVTIPKSDFSINHQSNLLFFGSCFAENIGKKFADLKFKSKINPFGIIYNPIAISNILLRALNDDFFTLDELFCNNDAVFAFDHHSKINSAKSAAHLEKLNNLLISTKNNLLNADVIFFTFGTAFYYKHLKSDKIVANCHKMPGTEFQKKLAEIEVINNAFQNLINQIKAINKAVKIVFTVSPVRHVKDGIAANNLSKSTLLLSINKITNTNKNCAYLPVYEVVMDELRDYRFYKEDLIHPNNTALNIIWEKLKKVFFEAETIKIMEEVKQLNLQINHKALNPNSEEHQKFKVKLSEKIAVFEKNHKIKIA